MDLSTSTASLLLFPIYTAGISMRQSAEDLHEFQAAASGGGSPLSMTPSSCYPPLRSVVDTAMQEKRNMEIQINGNTERRPRLMRVRTVPVHLDLSPSPSPTPSTSMPVPSPEDEHEMRRRRREERKRLEITSYRSEDGLLSPPPMRGLKRKNSTPNLQKLKGRLAGAGQSTPNLSLEYSTHRVSTAGGNGSSRSVPSTPTIGKENAPSKNFRPNFFNRTGLESPNMIVGPRRTTYFGDESEERDSPGSPSNNNINRTRRPMVDLERPRPVKSRTADSVLLVKEAASPSTSTQLIQPPLPSLLRPKSFWKNHPRSALTSPSYSPSSSVVRRSTFVAAGISLAGVTSSDYSPKTPRTPRTPFPFSPSSSSMSDSPSSSSLGETHHSLFNVSTIALAVETRREENVVCVPGEGFY